MKNIIISLLIWMVALCFSVRMNGQVGINGDGSLPDQTSILDLKSSSRGFLLPRLTYQQIMTITSPANGLQVFCLDDNKIYVFTTSNNVWKEVLYGPGTIAPWSCGLPMIINHSPSGGVAPVNKTTSYGTVTNIPGEPLKCWITSNLGATHQAVSVNDTSEASAGWYFQFNRKQGYQFFGTSRTPNTAWLSLIYENSNWIQANDPCVNEIGYGWRLPTISEWGNVDAAGGWTEWLGPWNSALKIHAAGFLNQNDGWIALRGAFGGYWSNLQTDLMYGFNMDFNPSSSTPNSNSKAYGFAVRCIKN